MLAEDELAKQPLIGRLGCSREPGGLPQPAEDLWEARFAKFLYLGFSHRTIVSGFDYSLNARCGAGGLVRAHRMDQALHGTVPVSTLEKLYGRGLRRGVGPGGGEWRECSGRCRQRRGDKQGPHLSHHWLGSPTVSAVRIACKRRLLYCQLDVCPTQCISRGGAPYHTRLYRTTSCACDAPGPLFR
jgi:hypothetical protein